MLPHVSVCVPVGSRGGDVRVAVAIVCVCVCCFICVCHGEEGQVRGTEQTVNAL